MKNRDYELQLLDIVNFGKVDIVNYISSLRSKIASNMIVFDGKNHKCDFIDEYINKTKISDTIIEYHNYISTFDL